MSGTWKDLTDNVNSMAGNLTGQVRNIAQVTTAVANGDLSKKITVDAKGEILELKDTINTMVDQLRSFAAEVTRVATRGRHRGQARRPGRGEGRRRHLEGPDRQRQHSWPATSPSQVRNIAAGHDRRRERRPLAEDHRRRRGARSSSSRTRSTRWSTSCARSPPRSRASPARSAPRASSAARPTCEGVSGDVEGPHRQREHAGRQPHRARCATSPHVTTAVANGDLTQEDHRRRRGRDPRAQEHHQHDGRPALAPSPPR